VLVLDDEQNILSYLRRLVGGAGFSIEAVADDQEALNVLQNKTVKVLISDQHLPGMKPDGWFEKVKSASPSTVYIVFSGCIDEEVLAGPLERGDVFWALQKPWNDLELITLIRRALERCVCLRRKRKRST